jgi:O-methyltransferase
LRIFQYVNRLIHYGYYGFLSRDPEKRYAARFQFLATLAKKSGFRMYNRNLWWIDDLKRLSAQWSALPKVQSVLKDRHYVLHSMAKSAAQLPGDTVECGVFLGAGSFVICLANENKPGHTHHVFDSFEGLSEPDSSDAPKDKRAYKWQKHDLAAPLERVQANLKRFAFVKYYQGWIPERFHEVKDRRFAFVHIDVDLYQPTHDSLAFFYERMIPGGIIICDDYGSTICPGATKAFDEFIADKPERYVVHLTTGQGYIVKQP